VREEESDCFRGGLTTRFENGLLVGVVEGRGGTLTDGGVSEGREL